MSQQRYNNIDNDIHNINSLIFIKQSLFYARSTSQSSSGLKKPVKYLQSAPELHWLKFTQNDFFEKLVLTHPPTFWPGVGNFFFWNPLPTGNTKP